MTWIYELLISFLRRRWRCWSLVPMVARFILFVFEVVN